MSKTMIPALFAVTIPFLILSIVFACLRFYCKRLKQAKFFVDDYLLIISWFLLFGQTVIILWSTQYGLGIPPAKLDMKKVPTLVAWTPTALFLALNAAGLSKLSFFITLIRVSSKRWQKIALWVVAIHSTILVVGTSVLGFVDCNFYRRTDPLHHDHCVPEKVGKILALTVLMHGAIVEFCLSFVPAMLLWNLEMKRREKIGLICAMSLGFISSILAALKTKDHWKAVFGGTGMPNTYILGREAVFGITEVCMTIIAACIPFLRPLLHKFVDGKGRVPEMPLALKNMAADSSSNGASDMGHPHTRLGSSSTFTTTTKHGGAREDDVVAILEAESVAEHDSQDAESNESGTIVRKTHVSVQYRPREVYEGECRGHCDAGVSGPGEN
ncbi:hypothetical protein GE21DRAFT_3657 [Neurospora crassa]|uniref:Rhodopsin domain-containing protein n=2 Tax=Neurospora crassa TaxID=5141 RepID=Q1K8P5_NEUCR|nr:hypothetical protein NCU08429 [Neurospora crassa OR74A]EAA34163.3 hypothetical protein NCU08429 [Neurospora crassa OR74A]KHE82415.1 hypothetical protein GE21DRAFT_3657 [Neurospora crassa]CAD70521.1 related to integral membrane protein (pth11) [Neurospora crassa]|eukprot:XP_963399.3 hypothetical protein NCU08429 [Neurospora crassa OR74A]